MMRVELVVILEHLLLLLPNRLSIRLYNRPSSVPSASSRDPHWWW